MKILVLDNYDSFTYNLVQYVQELLGYDVKVFRNDEISIDAVAEYDAIILSPGPGVPADAGIMPALLKRYASEKPILGVCLGHQAIGEAFGAEVINLAEVYHGLEMATEVTDSAEPLFQGIPTNFNSGRYHSWAVKKETLPEELLITAVDANGTIMAMRHRDFNVRGVQFHPESIMTEHGKKMLDNWLKECVVGKAQGAESEVYRT